MLTAITLASLVALTAAPIAPGDHRRSLKVGEIERNYLLHVPPQYDADSPMPVVLAFHGGGANAEQMVRFCGLNDKADEAGFIAVYPNGTGRLERALTFNAGNCCGYAMRNKIDDVEFVRRLLDDLASAASIDKKRVFATGMSNGAILCYRLASELSDRIAAIAPVAGPIGTATCEPKRPVPVMHFHGTDDEFAPFQGGVGKRSLSGTDFYSVDYTIEAWVKANGCPAEPVVTDEPDNADDGTTVERRTYSPGKEGSEVVLLVIKGGGHTWPGRDPRLAMLGKSTRDISANDLMWAFFERHALR